MSRERVLRGNDGGAVDATREKTGLGRDGRGLHSTYVLVPPASMCVSFGVKSVEAKDCIFRINKDAKTDARRSKSSCTFLETAI